MKKRTFARSGSYATVASLLCLTLSAPSRADEAPADKQDAARAAVPVQAGIDFAFNVIHLATNSDLIGADVAQVDDVLRSHLGLEEGKALVVTSVADDSPAAKAGIQKNDVLVAVGGEEITGPDALRNSLEASADKVITIGFIRGGKRKLADVTPKRPAGAVYMQAVADAKYWLGLGLAIADDTLRSQLTLPSGEGLVVTSVENDSPAAKAGVMVNDVLLKLDERALTTIEALSQQLQAIAEKPASLGLLRRGKPATLTVTAAKHSSSWQTLNLVGSGLQDVLLFTPRMEAVTFTGSVASDALSLTYTQAKPDLVRQIGELEAQVKQLEASLAALRAAIEPAAQPAQTGSEKKEEK